VFDEGFAKYSGGSLETLAATGGAAPDVRGDICSRRNAAAIAAAEEEQAPAQGEGVVGRNTLFAAIVGGAAVQHTELPDAAPHFDPIPVFVGPKPGWTGPSLAARATNGPTDLAKAGGDLPGEAKAYAPESAGPVSAAEGAEGPVTAPVVLQGAVKPPAAMKPVAATKPAKRVAEAQKVRKPAKAAGKADKKPPAGVVD
jgi:hypothetical protein